MYLTDLKVGDRFIFISQHPLFQGEYELVRYDYNFSINPFAYKDLKTGKTHQTGINYEIIKL